LADAQRDCEEYQCSHSDMEYDFRCRPVPFFKMLQETSWPGEIRTRRQSPFSVAW
jgi:hypothetical protein